MEERCDVWSRAGYSWAEQSRWTLLSGCSALEDNDECTEDEAEAGRGLLVDKVEELVVVVWER